MKQLNIVLVQGHECMFHFVHSIFIFLNFVVIFFASHRPSHAPNAIFRQVKRCSFDRDVTRIMTSHDAIIQSSFKDIGVNNISDHKHRLLLSCIKSLWLLAGFKNIGYCYRSVHGLKVKI